jgi:excisionase family DNA binding protein
MDDVRLLRIGEVADLLRISRTKVYELVSSGTIPSLHVGRSRRVPLRALAEWIDEQTTQLRQPMPRRSCERHYCRPVPQRQRRGHDEPPGREHVAPLGPRHRRE